MKDILPALLGFFFTVTILLILFQNCSFTVGCGGKHKNKVYREMMKNQGDKEEIEMEEVISEDPSANDTVEGYASIDYSQPRLQQGGNRSLMNNTYKYNPFS